MNQTFQFNAIKNPFNRDFLNISLNSNIEIFSGQIELHTEIEILILSHASIWIQWLPKPNIFFQGTLDSFYKNFTQCTVVANNTIIGKGSISKFIISKTYEIRGILEQDNFESQEQLIDRIEFSLVNFPIKYGEEMIGSEQKFWKGGLEFEINKARFLIHSRCDSNKVFDDLEYHGGYSITHHSLIQFENPVEYKKVIEILNSIYLSLRLLIGQDLGFCFLDFLYSSKKIHTIYLFGKVSPLESCNRLLNTYSKLNGSLFFDKIYKLTKDKSNKSALSDLIHWHNMANTNYGYLEGSLIIAQIGIELLYNWIICEKMEMITLEDAKKVSAISKIKTLVSFARIKLNIEELPSELKKLTSNKKSVEELIVQMRNYLVHSSEQKRSELESLDPLIFYHARNILLHIIENYILAIGHYKGQYHNSLKNELSSNFELEINI